MNGFTVQLAHPVGLCRDFEGSRAAAFDPSRVELRFILISVRNPPTRPLKRVRAWVNPHILEGLRGTHAENTLLRVQPL